MLKQHPRTRPHWIIYYATLILTVSILIDAPLSTARSKSPTFATIERASGGRLGVFAINLQTQKTLSYRAHTRFPLCSTNKVMGVAAILKESLSTPGLLDRVIRYHRSDLVTWSPVTKQYYHSGLPVRTLAQAAITHSDNTAINILMQQLGGPKAITTFARSIHDEAFNLVRWEPELNTAIPGDVRDTTTPKAMATSLQKLIFGSVLGKTQRALLKQWLIENKTGDARIRSATPKDWVVGDKTGTCAYGTTNDIGIVWPAHGGAIVLAIYFTQNTERAKARDDVIASAAFLIQKKLAH